MNLSEQLKEKYDQQYDDQIETWRMLGGKGKAQNIADAASGLKINTMLDVGSGDGSVLHWLDQMDFCPDITAVDISESGIEKIKSRSLPTVKQVLMFDGYQLPFEDNAFDLATCSHVLEHVEFPRMLIREIARVSRYQVFEIPIDFSLKLDNKLDHFLSYGHINVYTPQTFRFLLKTEGLKVEKALNRLYESELIDFMNRDAKAGVRYKSSIRRMLWSMFPFLLRIKPDVSVVCTSSTEKELEIMKDN